MATTKGLGTLLHAYNPLHCTDVIATACHVSQAMQSPSVSHPEYLCWMELHGPSTWPAVRQICFPDFPVHFPPSLMQVSTGQMNESPTERNRASVPTYQSRCAPLPPGHKMDHKTDPQAHQYMKHHKQPVYSPCNGATAMWYLPWSQS